MSQLIHFVPISRNSKTGPIPVSMSSKETCPDACPLKSKGCYAKTGIMSIHWLRLTRGQIGTSFNDFTTRLKKIRRGSIVRLWQAGDFPNRENGSNNSICPSKVAKLCKALVGKQVISYTHKPVLDEQDAVEAPINRSIIEQANAIGMTINLSANSPLHADKLIALRIAPVVTVVLSTQKTNCKTPNGNRIVICPATIKEGVTCSSCKICSKINRNYIVGFPSHGICKKTVDTISKG